MYRLNIIIVLFLVGFISCNQSRDNYKVGIPSPNSKIQLRFNLFDGEPYYLIYYGDDIVVDWSWLGFSGDSSEALHKKMLAGNVDAGPGFEKDGLDLFPGKKFNWLKVNLHKQENTQLGYAIVFMVYDEAIVFWYELNGEMSKKIAKMKEISELDLYSTDQLWKLSDTICMADTLRFPVVFLSEKEVRLSFSEINDKGVTDGYLLQRTKGLAEFNIQTTTIEKFYYNDKALTYRTDKKIIQIRNNN